MDSLVVRRGQGQGPVLVQDDELAVGIQQGSLGESPMPPDHLAVGDPDGGEKGRSEVAAEAVGQAVQANDVAVVHPHPLGEPQLFHRGLPLAAGELERPASPRIGRGEEQAVVLSPDRGADRQASGQAVGVAPEQFSSLGIDADDLLLHHAHQLILSVDVDQNGRGMGALEVVPGPDHPAVSGVEGHQPVTGPAHQAQDQVSVGNGAGGKTSAQGDTSEIRSQLVRPEDLPGVPFQAVQAAVPADGHQPFPGQEGSRLGPHAIFTVGAVLLPLNGRRVTVLPESATGCGLQGDHDFGAFLPVQGIEAFLVRQDTGIAVAHLAAPELRRPLGGP